MAEQTTLLPYPTPPHLSLFCLLGSSLPRAKSQNQAGHLHGANYQQVSFLRHWVPAATPAPELMGQFARIRSQLLRGAPRAPHLEGSMGLLLPARGRSFAAACLSPSIHPLLPVPLLEALGIGSQQRPKGRRRYLRLGRIPRGPCPMGLQQAGLELLVDWKGHCHL